MSTRLTASLILGVAIFLSGCSKPTYSVDLNRSLQMAGNEPNPVKPPDQLEVYASSSGKGIILIWTFERKTSDPIYTSTNQQDVLQFVSALRKDRDAYNPGDTRKSTGKTYLFRCKYFGSMNELHFALFAPEAPSRKAFVSIGGVSELRGEALLMWLGDGI